MRLCFFLFLFEIDPVLRNVQIGDENRSVCVWACFHPAAMLVSDSVDTDGLQNPEEVIGEGRERKREE